MLQLKTQQQKYALYCMQGSSFMEYTHDEPLTEPELIEIFKDYAESDGNSFDKNFWTLELCSDTWEFEVVKAKDIKKYEEGEDGLVLFRTKRGYE